MYKSNLETGDVTPWRKQHRHSCKEETGGRHLCRHLPESLEELMGVAEQDFFYHPNCKWVCFKNSKCLDYRDDSVNNTGCPCRRPGFPWCLIIICNSSPREPNALFWPPLASAYMWDTDIYSGMHTLRHA